jgi:hypothetical protein
MQLLARARGSARLTAIRIARARAGRRSAPRRLADPLPVQPSARALWGVATGRCRASRRHPAADWPNRRDRALPFWRAERRRPDLRTGFLPLGGWRLSAAFAASPVLLGWPVLPARWPCSQQECRQAATTPCKPPVPPQDREQALHGKPLHGVPSGQQYHERLVRPDGRRARLQGLGGSLPSLNCLVAVPPLRRRVTLSITVCYTKQLHLRGVVASGSGRGRDV